MKLYPLQSLQTGGLACLVLFGATIAASAQENLVVSSFDTEDAVFQWSRWWGAADQVYEFDPSTDAAGSADSGSLMASVYFDVASYGGDNQFALQGGFVDGVTIDGTLYTNLVCDIRWSADSAKNASGDFGTLEFGLRNSDWTQTALGTRTLTAADGDQWLHIEAPIDVTTPKLDTITGVWFKIWSGSEGGLTGSSVFWLDNVLLLANTNTAPAPAPSMAIKPVLPGLQLSASGSDANQRQNIRTQPADADGNPNNYSWVGASGPVTYSLTIKAYPDAAHSGFQTHLFLVSEAGMPYGAGDSGIDWNAPNVVFLQIANQADGTAAARFMYKTNLPSGNAMLWNTDPAAGAVGTLAILPDASALGTWSLTFHDNTEITLTAPSGASTNIALPTAAADLFADPLYAYVGIQGNNAANLGQSVTLGSVKVTGVPSPLEDTFAGSELDAVKWAVVAGDAASVHQLGPTARYWVSWDAPATGYILQSSPTLEDDSWVDSGLEDIFQVGSQKTVVIPQESLPGTQSGFFRLIQP